MGATQANKPRSLEEIEALEDAEDIAAAEEALAEMKSTGATPIPWETLRGELGLDDAQGEPGPGRVQPRR